MASRRDLIRSIPVVAALVTLGPSAVSYAEAAPAQVPQPTREEKLADAMARAEQACAEITAILGQEWRPMPTAYAERLRKVGLANVTMGEMKRKLDQAYDRGRDVGFAIGVKRAPHLGVGTREQVEAMKDRLQSRERRFPSWVDHL